MSFGAATAAHPTPTRPHTRRRPPAVWTAGRAAPHPSAAAEPLERLRWWEQPRSVVTVTGSASRDVEEFWRGATQQQQQHTQQNDADAGKPGAREAMEALLSREALRANKMRATGGTVAASLGDSEQFGMSGATSSVYKAEMCRGHVLVGKRGVQQSPEAMAAVRPGGRGRKR